MSFFKRYLNSQKQRDFVKLNWRGYLAASSDSFNLTFYVSIALGLLSIATTDFLSAVFKLGVVEHVANITIPLAIGSGFVFSGLATLFRRKKQSLFWAMRRFANRCLMVAINLLNGLAGVCFGLALPSFLEGLSFNWRLAVLWSFYGSMIFIYGVICFKLITFNFMYHKKNKTRIIHFVGISTASLGVYLIFFTINSTISKIVGSGF